MFVCVKRGGVMLFACLCVSEREKKVREEEEEGKKLVRVESVAHQPGSKSRSTEVVSWLTKVINLPTQ